MGYIYLMYNRLESKIYIGQTSERVKDRISKHFANESNKDLREAYAKYGRESFDVYILAECNNSELNKLEKFYIKLYDSFNNGYNMTPGGGGRLILYDEEKVLELYSKGESLNSIQEKTGYKWSRIRLILDTKATQEIEELHQLNLKTRAGNPKAGVIMLNAAGSEILNVFESKKEAYDYICNEQCKNIDKQNFYTRMSVACHSNRICYGHKWRMASDIDSLREELCIEEQKRKEDVERALNTNKLHKLNTSSKNTNKKPDKQMLEKLISKYTYEYIGKMYGVTGKAVRKWCDSYKLTKSKERDSSGVICVELNIQFKTFTEAARFLIENGYSGATNVNSLSYRISKAKKEGNTIENLHWI